MLLHTCTITCDIAGTLHDTAVCSRAPLESLQWSNIYTCMKPPSIVTLCDTCMWQWMSPEQMNDATQAPLSWPNLWCQECSGMSRT